MQNNGELFGLEFESIEDDDRPTKDEKHDYWNGQGELTIFVTLVIPEDDIFEFEVVDYSGCVRGADEILGIDYLLKDMWAILQNPDIKITEGIEITFTKVTVKWTRGDGWITEDDVDYYYEDILIRWKLWPWIKTKTSALWWKFIGWRLRK